MQSVKWRWFIVPLLVLVAVLLPSAVVYAAVSQTVVVSVSPNVGILPAPTGFTVTRVTDTYVRLDWVPNPGAANTLIVAKVGSEPTSRTDGYIVYYGPGAIANDTFIDLDIVGGKVFYAAYSESPVGSWSLSPATGSIGGAGMTLMALALLATGLTVAMFMTRQAMLGFPCTIFWAILSAFAYGESTIPWGDWQYALFFGSMGMGIFSMFAAYALRTKKEEAKEGDLYFDEGGDRDIRFIDEGNDGKNAIIDDDGEKPSRRIRDIRERASRRRSRWE